MSERSPAAALNDDEQQQMREMNEALLVSSVRQQELAEQAEKAESTARAGETRARKDEQSAREGEDRYRALYEKNQQIEAELRLSEGRYRTLFELGPVAVYSCDSSGVIRDFNRRAAELWGRTPALGDTDERFCGSFKMIRPDGSVLAHEQCPMAEVLAGTIPHARDAEVRIERPDGSQVAVIVNIRPLTNEQGEITGAINCFYDITDRKQAEQALRESEELRRYSQQAAGAGNWTWDQADGVVQWSQECYELFGIDPETPLHYESWRNVVHPEDREQADAAARRAMDRGEDLNVEYRIVHSRRGERWLTSIGRMIDPVNRPGFMTGISLDITERKQAEVALRDSEERFRMLADNMSQFAWTADATGWIYWYNQRWYDYTGTTLDQMQGWGWKQVHHPDHVQRVVERVQRSWDTGELWEDTFPLRGKDGEYRWFLSRARPIRDAAGNVLRWFGTNTDVTEQRELENQIKQQAQALADLNRRKDEFLAMLSHELRNPLAPIRNAVQLLRLEQGGSEMQKEAHGMIERQVSHLAHLVDDLLEVSRISTGRIHLQEQRIDFRGVVESALEVTRPQCGQKGHTVAKSLPGQPLWVYGDPVRLEQIVVNLLNNACKYTDRGGHFWIELKQQGHEAELRIRDNGIGIAPELLPRIFDLFTQADQSLDRAQGGLGIGLALVKSLVKMHRGRVEAQSALGQGSEFIVWLPLMSAPQGPSQVAAQTVNRSARSLKVLVVDDNVDAARGIAMLLRVSGHDVRVAHEGAAAMQSALEYVPDVVLLDIGLPVINGYQVAQWMRQESTLQDVVLVALTGYGQESDRRLSQAAGFHHHLVKPVDFTKVQSILATVANNLPKSAPIS